ncbi:MAG: ABC transporter substrate-binding protein [Eubacteriales bacterium]
MSDTNKEQHQYSSSAVEVAQKLKKAKLSITILSLSIVAIVCGLYFFNIWKEANDVDYIDGNILKIARSGDSTTGIPWKQASFIGQLTWLGLLGTDATFTEINSELAELVNTSADGLTYTLALKEGLQWSDGTPLTADDVVFSIESALLCAGTTNVVANALQQIKGAAEWKEVGVQSWENGGTHSLEGLSTDGNTITITLANPYSSFPLTLTQFVVMPRHALAHIDPSTITDGTEEMIAFYTNPVCSGMYMVDRVNADNDLELIHNPYYYDVHSDIERVILYGAYQSMYIDYYTTSSTTDMVSYRNMAGFDEYYVNVLFYRYFVFNLMGGYEDLPQVPQLDEDGKEVKDEDGEVVMVTDFDADREENYPMQNYLLRQAISTAIDRAGIAEEVYLGNATSDFSRTGNSAYTSFLSEQNLDEAKRLLIESGYDVERPIRIHHYHSDANSIAMLAKIKESLEAIGLTVIVEKTAGNDAMYMQREYDILLKGYAAQGPTDWYVEYLSTANYLSDLVGTDEFDDLTLQLEGAVSIDAYNKVWAEMQELDRNTMYRVPIVTTNDCTYINTNRIFVPEDMEFGNIRYRSDIRLDEWYVKKG